MTGAPLPEFLVIGAMKSGTTTLYNDLESQPTIALTEVKEPCVLVRAADRARAEDAYRKLYGDVRRDRRRGEVSTLYSQMPRYVGVAERAREWLGPDLRVIYLVRDPVERAISHHYHLIGRGHSLEPIDHVVKHDATLVEFGCYAKQLTPWLAAFGRDRILVIRFEDYVAQRAVTFARLGTFLDVAIDLARLPTEEAFNRAEDTRSPGRLRRLLWSDAYNLWLRRMVPARVRAPLRRLMLRRRPRRPRERPSPETVDYLIERLAPDAAELARILGANAPLWDLAATREKYLRGDREV